MCRFEAPPKVRVQNQHKCYKPLFERVHSSTIKSVQPCQCMSWHCRARSTSNTRFWFPLLACMWIYVRFVIRTDLSRCYSRCMRILSYFLTIFASLDFSQTVLKYQPRLFFVLSDQKTTLSRSAHSSWHCHELLNSWACNQCRSWDCRLRDTFQLFTTRFWFPCLRGSRLVFCEDCHSYIVLPMLQSSHLCWFLFILFSDGFSFSGLIVAADFDCEVLFRISDTIM